MLSLRLRIVRSPISDVLPPVVANELRVFFRAEDLFDLVGDKSQFLMIRPANAHLDLRFRCRPESKALRANFRFRAMNRHPFFARFENLVDSLQRVDVHDDLRVARIGQFRLVR